MKNSYIIFIDILLLIGVVYLFSMCSGKTTYNHNIIHSDYDINHYVDTIDGHIILTTVCDSRSSNNISVSTLEMNKTNNN